MALWTIERPSAGLSEDEGRAVAMRAKMCTFWFTGMTWVRSFADVERDFGRCFYEAQSENDLRAHAFSAGASCGAVRPAVEARPLANGGVAIGGEVDDTPLRDGGGALSLWTARHILGGTSDDDLAQALDGRGALAGAGWVRGFVDAQVDEFFAIYRASRQHQALAFAKAMPLPLVELRPAEEWLPADIEGAEWVREEALPTGAGD